MNAAGDLFNMPPDKEVLLRRAKSVGWASIALLLTIVGLSRW